MHISFTVYKLLSLLAFAATIFGVVYAVTSSPSRTASRLGLRGLHRQRALTRSDFWAQIEPLVRWLGVRLQGLIPAGIHEAIDGNLQRAGEYLGLTPEEFVALSMLSAVAGSGAGYIFMRLMDMGDIAIVFGTLIGAVLPYMEVTGAAAERIKRINRGLPGIIDLMALAMSAGLDFPNAVRQVVEKSSDQTDPLIEEVTLLLQELKLGRTRAQALRSFALRTHSVPVDEFVSALLQAEERGNPVAEALQVQAEAARVRRTVSAEEMASAAGSKLVLPLIMLLASILLLTVGPMVVSIMSSNLF